MKINVREPAETAPEERRLYLDRELSWLQFNFRVLHEAADPLVPLRERLKFLAIYYSNLDEFFMVRVGSISHRSVLLPYMLDEKTGLSASAQLKRIYQTVTQQQTQAEGIYRSLIKNLADSGVDVLDFGHLSKQEETLTKKLFAELRPLLTPHIVDARHPVPFLGDKERYLVSLVNKGDSAALALLPLERLPRFRVFEMDGRTKLAIISELVRHYAPSLFRKLPVRESCVMRVTRNADVFVDEDIHADNDDYRASMEKMLRKRKRQQIIRLQLSGKASAKLVPLISKTLNVSERLIQTTSIPLDIDFASALRGASLPAYPEQRPVRTVRLKKGEYIPYLREKDILLSFPYQSMTPFIDLLYEAADDPEVQSISITLYRLAASSKVAAALAYAADRGKDVLCLLELRARFDEQNNIDYSKVLEDAGCTVIYGLPGYKVHSKLCLIKRRRGDSLEYITQVGTGNYNEITGEQYCDLSLITSDARIGRDAACVFDALALGELPPVTEKLWIAPYSFKSRLLEMLERERQKGSDGFVSLKINSLNDLDVMRALVECSRAGTEVELFIRGICCLRPGVENGTENIRVRSVVGRYLEHSRILVFGRGETQEIFIGSGDLLNRNTRRRVEAFIPVTAPETREQVLEVMDAFRSDEEKGWVMQPDGSYQKRAGEVGSASQDRLSRYFSERIIETLPQPQRKRRSIIERFFRKRK